MTESPSTAAQRLLVQAAEALVEVTESGSDAELVSVLATCEGVVRRLDRVAVDAIAVLERRGVFAERGYKSAAAALSDLLGWERFEARRRVLVAEQVTSRVGLDGTPLPARLPATAAVFAAGATSLRHVETIARLLGTAAAGRLSLEDWSGAEQQLAAKADVYTPSELHDWGTRLVEALDRDGEEPDDRPPAQVNELHLTRLRSGGGKIKGRFDDAAMFDAIASVIDATGPATDRRRRPVAGQRQAEALADVCGYVLDHKEVPACGGSRPHVNVLIRLDDLENRARAACLDFGGTVSPESLRMLCCDAAVVPIVMNGKGQPLDVGRATRTIPDGLRRAVAARDRGCAHPGCGRPVSWRNPSHRAVGARRSDHVSNLVMLCRAHHRADPLQRLGGPDPRRGAGVHPAPWIDPEQRPRRRALPHLVG